MKKPGLLNIIQITPMVSFLALAAVVALGYYFHSFNGLGDLMIALIMLGPVVGIIYGLKSSRSDTEY